jgi:hypothetical protein
MHKPIHVGKVIGIGLVAGIAIAALEYVVHAIVLLPVYDEYAKLGVMATEAKPWGWIHYLYQVLAGIPLVILYLAMARAFGRSVRTACVTGVLAGVMAVSISTALYAFYNLGVIIPLGITIDKLLEPVLAALIAFALYKE